MPFTMPNFPILTFEQANPLLAGIKYGAGIGNDLLNAFRTNLLNQELQARMPYVGEKEKAALKNQQLMNIHQGIVNQYLPKDYQTTFAARAGNLQKQLSDMAIAKWRMDVAKKYLAEQEAAQKQAQGQPSIQNQITDAFQQTQPFQPSDIIPTLSTPGLSIPSLGQRQRSAQDIFGTSPELTDSLAKTLTAQKQIQQMQPQQIQPQLVAPQQQQQLQQAIASPMQQQMQGAPIQQGTMQQRGPDEWSSYPKLAFASKVLGLDVPKPMQIPGTGEIRAFGELGSARLAQGLSAYEEAKEKERGKFEIENYKENFESYKSLKNQDLALDTMIDVVNNDPAFKDVTGPIGSRLAKWGAATPEAQRTYGTLASSSGQIKLLIAPGLKGAFTGKDQTMIDDIKANPTDPKDVFVGKLKAQKLIGTILQKRTELAMQYQDEGMKPLQAMKRATKETPLSKYKPIVDKLIHPSSEKLNAPVKKGFKRVRMGNSIYEMPEDVAKKAVTNEGYSYA